MKYIQGVNRKRIAIIEDCLDDYISEDNEVRAIDAIIDSLDMVELGFESDEVSNISGARYNPKDMLKLIYYGKMNSITASRPLEKEAGRNIEVMWLIRRLKPDYKTISNFKKQYQEPIVKVFNQLNELFKNWDLFGKQMVAIDGTKKRAFNSKKKFLVQRA